MKVSDIKIRKAKPQESESLSALAIRSKAHWNYSDEFLQDCMEELSYTAEQISHPNHWFYVASLNDQIQGFYQLVKITPDEIELEALFVEPKLVGQRLGKILFEHAIQLATNEDFSKVQIQSDPNATEFYLKMGCTKTGELESQSIPGRFLPLLSFDLRSTTKKQTRN